MQKDLAACKIREAGAGVNAPVEKATAEVKKFVADSSQPLPPKDLYEIHLP